MLVHLGRESIERTTSTILSEKRRSLKVMIMMTLMFSVMKVLMMIQTETLQTQI